MKLMWEVEQQVKRSGEEIDTLKSRIKYLDEQRGEFAIELERLRPEVNKLKELLLRHGGHCAKHGKQDSKRLDFMEEKCKEQKPAESQQTDGWIYFWEVFAKEGTLTIRQAIVNAMAKVSKAREGSDG